MNGYRTLNLKYIFIFLILFLILIVNIFPDAPTDAPVYAPADAPAEKTASKAGNMGGSSADNIRGSSEANPAGIKTISLELDLIKGNGKKQADKAAIFPLYYAVESLFNRQYYPYAQIKKTKKTDYNFKVVVLRNRNHTKVTISENTSTLKISSALPSILYPPLVSVITGDVFYLFAELAKFNFINYSAPPQVSLSINTNNLANITGWKQNDLLPLDIAPSNRGLLITLEGGFLTLGNSLEITYNTLLDIFYQKKQPMPLHPLTASSDLLGNITVLSRNAESVKFINTDRTENSRDTLKLKKTDNFLYTGLNTGGFAILDETTDSEKTIFFYKMPDQGKNEGQNERPEQSQNSTEEKTYQQPYSKYPLNSSFISAMASDYDGNLWLYDSIEKRIKIVGKRGREIGSVKPIIQPNILMFPQVLTVCPDGSFIIGSSGILVKFDTAGIPVWKLKTYKLNGIRSVPAFYRVACSEQDSSLFLLDIQSHRVLKFQENPPAEKGISFSEDTVLYRIQSSSLTPVEFEKAKKKKLALLKKRAGTYYEKQLDLAEAEKFYRQSLEDYREIRRKDPVDEETLKEIRKLINARNRVKGKAGIKAPISVSLLTHAFFESSAGSQNSSNILILNITNLTGNRVNDLTIRMNIPGFSSAVKERRISQLLPYRTRKITVLLPLKRDTASLKSDMEAGLNTVIDFTVQNEPGEMQFSFPVYFKNRNYIKAHAGGKPDFTQFYMPKNRVVSEFASSIARYYNEFLYLKGAEPKGTALMSLIEALLKEENIKQNSKLKSNKDTLHAGSLYIEDPPLFPAYYLYPENGTDISALTAVNNGLPGEGRSLSALIFIASVSANLGFKPSLLYREGETILLIDTAISADNLNISAGFFNELKALAAPLPGEDENKETDIVIPVYSAGIERPASQGKPDNSAKSFLTMRTIVELLEHIHRIGIESYQRLKVIENPVPAVYHGINGENYIPIFAWLNPGCLNTESGKDTNLDALLSNIGIGKKIRKK